MYSIYYTEIDAATYLGSCPETVRKMYKKTIPVQTWTGPEGSKMQTLPDFKTVGP